MNWFKKYPSVQSRNYLSIGLGVYAVELLVIVFMQQITNSPTVAVGVSFWAGLVISFLLQKLITFNDKRLQRSIVASQFAAVTTLVLFNFGFTLIFTRLLETVAPLYITRALALGITAIWNFYLYKTRIFGSPNQLPPIE